MNKIMGRIPGLNGLRFFAALAVMICHIEQIKLFHSIQSCFPNIPIQRLGPLGVTFFFVLSGFLITYLLLEERKSTGKILIKNFYLRRILRIWPVYYTVTALSFFVFPFIPWLDMAPMPHVLGPNYFKQLGLFLLILPHISQLFVSDLIYGGALWSVGVEEHFYLLWPHLLNICGRKLPFLFFGIIILWIFLKLGIHLPNIAWGLRATSAYFTYFRIDCMAIGALGALWPKPAILFRRDIQVITYLCLLYCLISGIHFFLLDDTIYSILFLIVILNIAGNPRSLLKLTSPFLEFMGKISYGLYAYQWICIAIVVKLVIGFGIANSMVANLFIYYGAFGLTTGIAFLSYRFLEEPFLQMRNHTRQNIPVQPTP